MSIQTHWNYILRWSPRRQKMLENALFVLYIITLKTLQDFYFILRRVKIYFGLSRPRPGARVQEKFKGVKRMTSEREGAFWNPYELGFLWTLSTLSGLYMQDCLSHIQCLHGIRKRHFSTSSLHELQKDSSGFMQAHELQVGQECEAWISSLI